MTCRPTNIVHLSLTTIVCLGATTARAQIGEPQGSFTITVSQGGSVIASDTVTVGPGGELEDLKASFQDGDPEDATQIGLLSPMTQGDPIILKLVTEGDSTFRLTHWFIDAPINLADVNTPGPISLFQPGAGNIDVVVTGFGFDNNAATIPFIVPNNTFYTSFMRNEDGHFYNLPNSNTFNQFGNGVIDVQVPGAFYVDGTPDPYRFEVIQTGSIVSWAWRGIPAPTVNTLVTDEFGNVIAPATPGHVFELGLAVAFIPVPEPGTLALLGTAALLVIRRRKHA